MNKSLLPILAALLLVCSLPLAAQQRIEPEAKKEGVTRVICFGDSITGHLPYINYQGQYFKFADLLDLMLKGHMGTDKVEVLNAGYAGDKTYKRGDKPGALPRLEKDIISKTPDICIVMYGANDSKKTEEDIKTTEKNLIEIVNKLKAAKIKPLLVIYHKTVPNPKHPEKAWVHIDKTAPAIEAAAKATDTPVLDMRPFFEAALKKYPAWQLVNKVDGIHLSPRGELVYAHALFDKLKKLKWLN